MKRLKFWYNMIMSKSTKNPAITHPVGISIGTTAYSGAGVGVTAMVF